MGGGTVSGTYISPAEQIREQRRSRSLRARTKTVIAVMATATAAEGSWVEGLRGTSGGLAAGGPHPGRPEMPGSLPWRRDAGRQQRPEPEDVRGPAGLRGLPDPHPDPRPQLSHFSPQGGGGSASTVLLQGPAPGSRLPPASFSSTPFCTESKVATRDKGGGGPAAKRWPACDSGGGGRRRTRALLKRSG